MQNFGLAWDRVCGAHVEPLLRTSDWSGGGSGPSDPAGDGRAIVVLVGCLMSLGGHLLGPVGICPPCFPFIRCIVVLCLCRGWGITDNSAQNQLGPHKTRPMPTRPKFIRQLGPNS